MLTTWYRTKNKAENRSGWRKRGRTIAVGFTTSFIAVGADDFSDAGLSSSLTWRNGVGDCGTLAPFPYGERFRQLQVANAMRRWRM